METKKVKSNLINENQILYKVVSKKNIIDKTKPAKYYAQVQNTGRMSLDSIEEELEKSSSVTRGDVKSIMANLQDLVCKALRRGNVVQLGGIGTFRVSVSSKGTEKADNFTAQQITKARVNFRAGTGLSDTISKLKYAKYGVPVNESDNKSDGGGTKAGDDSGDSKDKDDTPRDEGNI